MEIFALLWEIIVVIMEKCAYLCNEKEITMAKRDNSFYMVPHFSIIQSLCRACSSSNQEMIVYQISRLAEAYRKDGNEQEALALEKIIKNAANREMLNSSVVACSSYLKGETLTKKIIIPVDKETSVPLLEVYFPEDLPTEEPIFDRKIREAVESVILEWVNYDKLVKMNATPSRSCLVYGLPGTGKTHLAKWIARSVGLPIVSARLDGIVSSFLGTSSRNISNLFSFANRFKCVLLLDEFDAIAKLRDDPQEVGEVKRIVNTLLQNLDGRDEIGFTIGVTNHEQLLDPAIWRRFDVQIEIPKPSELIIPSLLTRFLEPLKYSEAETSFLSWCLQGCSGADILKMSNWLKRMSIIEEYQSESLLDLMRRYILLNTGRVSETVKDSITKTPDEIYNELKARMPDLKQKDIAGFFNMTPSSLCKLIQKTNKTD